MKTLITGADGFIGRHLVKALEGQDIVTLDRNSGAIRLDITSEELAEEIARYRPECIIHLAAVSSIPYSVEHPHETFLTNVAGTENLLECARACGIRKFVFLSSAQVYGSKATPPLREDLPAMPDNPYGISKAAGELLVAGYKRAFGMETVILRLFSVFGEGQDEKFVIPGIIRQALEGKGITINDPTPIRDFVHVSDVVAAILLLSKKGEGIYNIGSGIGTSIGDLAEAVRKLTGSPGPIRTAGKQRSHDIPALIADIQRIRGLGWHPRGLEESLKLTLEASR